jgi:hypothetical protein
MVGVGERGGGVEVERLRANTIHEGTSANSPPLIPSLGKRGGRSGTYA